MNSVKRTINIFLNLEKRNHRKKHITSLTKDDGSVQCDPKGILDEEERFYREIHLSKNTNPERNDFKHFFESPHLKKLGNEEAESCEGLLTIKECSEALNKSQNNKTPGSDGFTIEFYRSFWNAVAPFMVDSFNYGFENGLLTISQRLAIISLIPKKDQNLQYQKKLEASLPS